MNLQNAKRIMIFGDTASGKSTFAQKLGKHLKIPVIHIDEISNELGRENSLAISQRILEECYKPTWIIEGKGFTKDPTRRIDRADLVIVFKIGPWRSLFNHLQRWLKFKMGIESLTGGVGDKLLLRWFIRHIFVDWEPLSQKALEYAQSQHKDILIIRSHAQANRILSIFQ